VAGSRSHGFPLFAPLRQMSDLNAPCCVDVCPGQKMPVALDRDDVPVVSGLRLTAMFPMNCAQRPPGQSEPVEQVLPLLVPRKHFCTPVAAAGDGQSLETPTEFFD
jgi:hypothetical protein